MTCNWTSKTPMTFMSHWTNTPKFVFWMGIISMIAKNWGNKRHEKGEHLKFLVINKFRFIIISHYLLFSFFNSIDSNMIPTKTSTWKLDRIFRFFKNYLFKKKLKINRSSPNSNIVSTLTWTVTLSTNPKITPTVSSVF